MDNLVKRLAENNWDVNVIDDMVEEWHVLKSYESSLIEYLGIPIEYQDLLLKSYDDLVCELYKDYIFNNSLQVATISPEGYLISSNITCSAGDLLEIAKECSTFMELLSKLHDKGYCSSDKPYLGSYNLSNLCANRCILYENGKLVSCPPRWLSNSLAESGKLISNILAKHPYGEDFRVFSQFWGSTALGYTGLGCDAITKGTTVVVQEGTGNNTNMYCYLGRETLAYAIHNPNHKFMEDLKNHALVGQYELSKKPNLYGQMINNTAENPNNTFRITFFDEKTSKLYSTSVMDIDSMNLSMVLNHFSDTDTLEKWLEAAEQLERENACYITTDKTIPCTYVFKCGKGLPKL